MPAVTADTAHPSPPARSPRARRPSTGPVRSVTTAPQGFEGEGFPVRRAFAGVDLADLDPFIHMDQMGEVDYAPGEPRGTDWHPHRGFETVTYMIDGTFQHQDSHGGGGVITNGATQWMTAGGGILHIETPPEELVISGGLFHGIQLWVNLPAQGQDDRAPLPEPRRRPGHARCRRPTAARWCASSPATSPATAGPGSTHTPISVAHATVVRGCPPRAPVARRLQRPRLRAGRRRDGRRASGGRCEAGQLVVFGAGDTITLDGAPARAARRAAPRWSADPRAGRGSTARS